MESFFALLQRNVLHRGRWSSRGELRSATVGWIETTHHGGAGNAVSVD
ncbi:transposase [Rhodococcus sp. SC4]|nr:transposase [Rhodococcus sp. SC4]